MKDRIKNILNYKKPSAWITLISVILIVCLLAGFMTAPASENKTDKKEEVQAVVSEGEKENTSDTSSKPSTTDEDKDTESKPEDTSSEQESKPEDTSSEQNSTESKPITGTEEPDKIISDRDKIGDLSLEMVKQIKEDYRGSNTKRRLDDIGLYYFDTFSDGTIVINIKSLNADTITGDGISIDIFDDEYIYVHWSRQRKEIYKNRKFYSLKEAYDNGVISKKIVDEYFERFPEDNHTKDYITGKDDFGDLTLKELVYLKWDYYNYDFYLKVNSNKKEYQVYEDVKLADIYVTNLGTLSNGYKVIKFDISKNVNNPVVFNEKIGQYDYSYEYGCNIYLYKKLYFKDIKTAYDKNNLTNEDLDELFEMIN